MPAIPLIVMGVSTGIQAYQAHKAGQAADKQGMLADQQSGLAKEMAGFGRDQYSTSMPALQKAMSYYTTLANGNRGATNSLLAPQRASVMDTYAGAQAGLEGKMAPGPQRDREIGELTRQKAGQLGMMPMQARNDSVGKLAGLGTDMNNSAGNFMSGGQSGFNSTGALNASAANMQAGANGQWNSIGNSLMQALLPYLMGQQSGGSKKPLQSSPTMGNVQWNLPGGFGGSK